ncbi:MAG: GatB/YqeY domain-containing protein [Vicingaceae bacterium]
MSLSNKINSEITDAMKAKKADRLLALRAIKSELLMLATSGKESGEEAEIKALQKLVKQRKESADLYESQSRHDLAEVEIFQADVISEFLPKQLTETELHQALKGIVEKLGANGPQDMGKVMGAATKELGGKADGKTISETVKQLLS